MSAPSSRPSIAELRAVTQPASIFARNSGEHWAGRLYVRRVSPFLTRRLIGTRLTPNAVTWLMIAVGVAAAVLVALDGIAAATGAVVLIQLQILLDCSDGELARWRRQFSPVGIYLDRFGHYLTETLFPIALGIRAGEPVLGLVAAVLALAVRTESALVAVARLESGQARAEDTAAVAASRVSVLARLRSAVGVLPVFRAFVAMEFTLLALAAAIVDAATGGHAGSSALVVALVPIAAVTAVGHLVVIVTSSRLR
ncbi:MAG: CDP-alcohol phosphatidyltransferase family protein [Solirubrobacteraceae bacterium]